jgi:hypothetical protein
MTNVNERLAIVESLNSLDASQTSKVLDYIKGLTNTRNDLRHQMLKHKALKEIRQALGNSRTLTRF